METIVDVDGGRRGQEGGSENELEEFRHKNWFSSGEGVCVVEERVGGLVEYQGISVLVVLYGSRY